MNKQEYQAYWKENDEPLYTYSLSQVEGANFTHQTLDFLTNWGFPAEAAPHLSFDDLRSGSLLTANHAFNRESKELNNYLVIGSDGNENPLCLDTSKQDEVVCLHHDIDIQCLYVKKP